MEIEAIDHIVLTVRDIASTCQFYTDVLGMKEVTGEDGRKALQFGWQKINPHTPQTDIQPLAEWAMPGSTDLCLLSRTPLKEVIEELNQKGIKIIAGPVDRYGANGPIRSVYLRDPDENLVEICNYINQTD